MPELITTAVAIFECVNDDKLEFPEINRISYIYKIGDKIDLTTYNYDTGETEKICELEVVDIKHELFKTLFPIGDQIVKIFVKRLKDKETVH